MIIDFYVIEGSAEVQEVGYYPQTTSFLPNYDKDAPTSAYNIRWNELPSFIPNLEGIQIHKKSKITDVMSFFLGGDYPLLSSKAIDILEKFRLPKYNKVEATLLREQGELSYYVFLFESKAINSLILKESLFATQNNMTQYEGDTFIVSTLSELKNIAVDCVMNSKNLLKKKLIFDSSILDYDLFNLDFLGGTHVSVALAHELKKQKVSGIKLHKVSYEVK